MSRKIYKSIKENISKIEAGTIFKSTSELMRALEIENYCKYDYFDKYLGLVCSYTTIQNGKRSNKCYIINQIYDEAIPFIHGHYTEDNVFEIDSENAYKSGVYVIYAYDELGELHSYVGSSTNLRRRYHRHKYNVRNKIESNGAKVLGMKGAKIGPLFICNKEGEKQLRTIEESYIVLFNQTKRGLSNSMIKYDIVKSLKGLGSVNWELLCELGVFRRVETY